MSVNLSEKAKELLLGIGKKVESTFSIPFRASKITASHCAGHSKVETVTPLLKELENNGYLKNINKEGSKGKYKVTKKAIKAVEEIKEEAKEDLIYNTQYREDLEEEIRSHKMFIISTGVSGKPAYTPFVNSIRTCKEYYNMLPIILPCDDVASRGKKAKKIEMDPELLDFKAVTKDINLNENLILSAIKNSAKQINPLQGLNRVPAIKDASVILASPKRRLKYMPSFEIPHALISPGAVTINNYDTDLIMSKRTSKLAELDHAYGAVIVEVEDNKIFHFRDISAAPDGSFTDLGISFKPDGTISQSNNIIMVLGDSHTGCHDEKLLETILEFIDKTGIKTLVLHDVFNACSISHHKSNKAMEKARDMKEGKTSLENEIRVLINYLRILRSHVDEIIIVDSNHDKHLEKYLQQQRYVNDFQNLEFASKLIPACIMNKNVVQYAVEEVMNYKDSGIKWLQVDETYERYGVHLSTHGDLGANGSRGNIRTYRDFIGNCVVGHSHSGCIMDNAYSVGTTAELRQGYNHGLSSWTRTCCLVYEDGTKQLINFILNKKGQYTYTAK